MSDTGLIVFLGCADIESTHAFHAGALGLALDRDQGLCRIYRVPGGGRIGFCTHLPVVRAERSPIITLVVEDVDAWHARLITAGVDCPDPPRDNPRFRIRHFFVRDPDGYCVEVQRFLD